MATTCVFVTVSEGVKTLIRTVDVEVNQKHTFDELLDIVLELKDVALESFDERKVTVTMRATLSSPSVEIGKRTATVASRIGAGHFVAFNVAPPPPKPMASTFCSREAAARTTCSSTVASGPTLSRAPRMPSPRTGRLPPPRTWRAATPLLPRSTLARARSTAAARPCCTMR